MICKEDLLVAEDARFSSEPLVFSSTSIVDHHRNRRHSRRHATAIVLPLGADDAKGPLKKPVP
jgi:hypothetical protein